MSRISTLKRLLGIKPRTTLSAVDKASLCFQQIVWALKPICNTKYEEGNILSPADLQKLRDALNNAQMGYRALRGDDDAFTTRDR